MKKQKRDLITVLLLVVIILLSDNLFAQSKSDFKAKLDTLGNVVTLTIPEGLFNVYRPSKESKSYIIKEGEKRYIIRREDLSKMPVQNNSIVKN